MSEKITTVAPPVRRIEDLPYALAQIAGILNRERSLRPADMRRLVLESAVQESDLLPWADYDHPVADGYGRRLIFRGAHFEIMVMSWNPGDFSAIHDHGHTQWGCVQVFGPAEHATFRMDKQEITTLARWQMQTGEAIGVHHDLLHQMGNATDVPFLSLHVYGEPEGVANVTGDARVLDLIKERIQYVDGGVFYHLPEASIKRTSPAPPADFPTRLRHTIEVSRRLKARVEKGDKALQPELQAYEDMLASSEQRPALLDFLRKHTDESGHKTHHSAWNILNWELKEAAKMLRSRSDRSDQFQDYAALYDAVIGQPCLEQFMAGYLRFVADQYRSWSDADILSLGVGTGLTESFIIRELGADPNRFLGIDVSAAMVAEAGKRLRAEVGDILTLSPEAGTWDIAYSGLNVFHYIPFERLEDAIARTSGVLRSGGFFVGDFITPDHIRWYPNAIISEDQRTISLRTPELVEDRGRLFQESSIVNIQFKKGSMHVHDAGVHRRFLPPMHRIRTFFESHFAEVTLLDAHSLEELPDWADSCPSTRYVVIARKA